MGGLFRARPFHIYIYISHLWHGRWALLMVAPEKEGPLRFGPRKRKGDDAGSAVGGNQSIGWILRRRLGDAQTGGGTTQWESQQVVFCVGDQATHSLVAERCHGRVSRVYSGKETRRRTNWWRNGAIGGSTSHFSDE